MKEKNQIIGQDRFTEFLIYTTPQGKVKLEIFLHNDNLWLTQAKIAQLFDTTPQNITQHLKNIYDEGEADQEATCKNFLQVQNEGEREVSRNLVFYNLDVIISVGYRINSLQATHFRIWATERLKEYIIKGFTMNDERLKNADNIFGKDYFDELLARIRDIRSSERRFYQKITDIYAQCSADYDANSEISQQFFSSVQNKLHFAIIGQTSSEIIANRVDSGKPNMGLTTWKNSPNGKIRKADISIAKNYLSETELTKLNRIVSMYLDYAELQAQNRKIMKMKDWVEKLNAFLQFNDMEILQDKGKVSHNIALALAEQEYDKYQVIQDKLTESDFDRIVKKTNKLKEKND